MKNRRFPHTNKWITEYLQRLSPILTLAFLLTASAAFGADHYVSPNGSASWANSTDIDSPCLLTTAIQNVAAGDTVYMLAGTHTISAWQKATQDGTQDNPIVFINYDGDDVTIKCTYSNSWNGAWDIRGNYWRLEESNAGDVTVNYNQTGIKVGWSGNADHFHIKGWTFKALSAGGDNAGALRMEEGARFFYIGNVTVDGPGTTVNGNNAALWITKINSTNADPSIIENCELYDAPSGIYHKHATGSTEHLIIRNNYIHDCGSRGSLHITPTGATITNNLLVGKFDLGHDGGTGAGENNTITHNTIIGYMEYYTQDDSPAGCWYNDLRDNIFTGTALYHQYNDYGTAGQIEDYNIYPAGTAVRSNRTNYTRAAWSSYLGGCPGSDNSCGSISGSVTFVGGNSPSTIAGYALATGSIGKNGASDFTDIGADVTKIGIGQAGGSLPTSGPANPSGLTLSIQSAAGSVPNTPIVESVKPTERTFGSELIFADDFENGVSMAGKYATFNSNNGNLAVVSGSGFGGSNNAIQASWQQGQVDAGSFSYMFGRNPVQSLSHTNSDFREIYWRFYMKTSDGWNGNPHKLSRATCLATSGWAQSMIAHVWGSSGTKEIKIDPVSGIDSYGNLATTGYNDFSNFSWLGAVTGNAPVYDTNISGIWQCIEVHVKLNTPGNSDGIFELWVDGTLDAQITGLDWVGTWQDYGINAIMFGNYWNGGAPQAQQRYLDNIIISTQPIGPAVPIIYKSQFEDPDQNDTQGAFEAQVSSTPDVSGLVWSGQLSSSANTIKIDTNNGLFTGSLAGNSSLNSGVYYAQVRQADDSGNYSGWSAWKIFNTAS